MQIAALIAVYILIVLIDIPSLIPKTSGSKSKVITYCFILIIAFTISLLLLIKKAPTSPSKIIEAIVKDIMG